MPKEEQSVCKKDEEEVVVEEVVGYRMLAGSRLFFNTLSGLLVPEVFLFEREKRRGNSKKIEERPEV